MRARAGAAFTVAVLALWVAAQVGAGSAEDPEITDPEADHLPDGAGNQFPGADILAVWIDNETADEFQIHLQAQGEIRGGTAQGAAGTTVYDYEIAFTVGATAYEALATVSFEDGVVAGGVAGNASTNGTVLTFFIPKANVGDPAAGAVLGNMTASTSVSLGLAPLPPSDTAPDEGFGRNYTFSAGGNATNTTTTTTTTTSVTTTTTTTGTTTTTTTTTTGTTTTIPTLTTGPVDEGGDSDITTRLLEEERDYFLMAVGAGLLLIILAAIGLKRWAL